MLPYRPTGMLSGEAIELDQLIGLDGVNGEWKPLKMPEFKGSFLRPFSLLSYSCVASEEDIDSCRKGMDENKREREHFVGGDLGFSS